MSLKNLAGVKRRTSVSVPKQQLAVYRKCGLLIFQDNPMSDGTMVPRQRPVSPILRGTLMPLAAL
jgi:hypothetical protein